MSITDKFTEALVNDEMNKGLLRGYKVKSTNQVYDDYLYDDPQVQDTCWKQLRNQMDQKHEEQYGKGSGGELKEENDRPPKMAAFASSSRMIYTLSAVKNTIPKFRFEEQLPTTIAGVANMDGYQELDRRFTFVEAKCREPYSHSVKQAIKRNYKEVYSYLREKMPRVFSCVMEDIPDAPDGKEPQNKMNVVFFCHNRIVGAFDIKQMISHLLGVATKFLIMEKADREAVKRIQFLYLLYNPAGLQIQEPDRSEVMRIYEDTCWCAEHYHFEEMFGYIVDYLAPQICPGATGEELAHLKATFCFKLCDQNSYVKQFK